jgi:transposase
MARGEELTDEQWSLIEPLLPELPKRDDGKGRPWRENREIMNGILWILRSGARWKDLPDKFPSCQTCHRRFQAWVQDGSLRKVLEALAQDLETRGEIDLSECFIDGTFVIAKKGATELVRLSEAKARNSWWWQTMLLFHSPSTHRVLRRTKSDLSKKLFKRVSLITSLTD